MRFVYLLLTGIGFGLVVAGNTLSVPAPPDPTKALAEAMKRLPADQAAAAEMMRTLQSAVQQSAVPSYRADADKYDTERNRTISAILNGFGAGFMVVGILGLLLSLYGAFEKRMAQQRAATTPPQG